MKGSWIIPKLSVHCSLWKNCFPQHQSLVPERLEIAILLLVLLLSRFVSDSLRPHRRQPTSLPCPWDSPGKNTGVGCHFLLQCMKVKSESEVAQSCPTLHDPVDCSLQGSSIHGIFQARVLEWGAIAFSDSYSRVREIKTKINKWNLTKLKNFYIAKETIN